MPPSTITPTPVDTAIFTSPQERLYESAAAQGGGVPTYDSQHPALYGPQRPTEPTVLSSANISENVIPDMHKRADALSQKGSMVGADGNVYYADQSMVPAPIDAEYDGTNWTSGGKTYGAAPQYVSNEKNDPDIARTNELLSSMKGSLDATTLGSVHSIEQQYDMLRGEQQEANARQEKAQTRTNLLAGTSRYAPLDAAGVTLASTSYGLSRIAKLDADENAAIAQVRQAQQNGNFQLMEKALGVAEDIRQEKQAAAAKLADTLSKATADAQARKLAVLKGNAVSSVLDSGITDPNEIYKTLQKNGVDITPAEVKDIISGLGTAKKTSDFYSFTNTDIGKLLGAGVSSADAKALQDYYNGTEGAAVPKLSTAQQAVLSKILTGAGAGGNAFTFTPTQKSQLLSGGFALADVTAMQQDVAKYGLGKVTEGMDEKQASLVKRVLAGSDSVSDTGNSDTKLTRDAIATYFNIPDNDEKPGFDLLGHGSTNSESLDSIMSTIARYQAVGYSDKDILDMIQNQK